MGSETLSLITIPIFTGAIGYLTNWSGVIMLFYPVRFAGIRVRALPTRFGRLGYHMRAVGDTVVVSFDTGLRMPAAGILVRNPNDLPARRIVVDGRDASPDANGDLVLLVLPREVRFEY